MVYAGSEHGGDANSLSVLSGSGATSNDWSCSVVRTPGRINAGQAINPVHPTPFGSMIMIYSNLGSSGRLAQMIGGAPVKNNEIIFCRKGSEEGTNLVYVADMWHELGSVKIDGRDAAWTTNAPRTYTVNVGAGSSNNTITVDAEAVIQKNLETDYGLTRDNRYTKAILEWLCAGKDLKGNPWANPGSGELKLAEYWPWAAHDESERLPLSLTAMYWLDIDPTEGGWVFRAGTTDIAGEIDPATGSAPTSSSAVTNVRISVSMMITNVNEAAGWPAHKTAHAPRALRGLEPGSNSRDDYPGATTGWTSATFKVTGIIANGFTGVDNPEDWIPLRWFVFDENSFAPLDGSADAGTAKIEVADPRTDKSPVYLDGFWRYPDKNVFYRWAIDTRLKPYTVEMLNSNSYYKVTP
jgi:hypothetical protein